MKEPKAVSPIFSWGSTIMTPKVQAILPSVDLIPLLERHVSGDWGDIDEADKARNDAALKSRESLLSVYKTPASPEGEIWVLTEANRSITTFLLPSEY